MVKALENWQAVNIPHESPIPELDTKKPLPAKKIRTKEIKPEILEKLGAIDLFTGDWENVKYSMATLVHRLSDADTEYLCANLRKLDTPPPVSAELAENWFVAIANLPSEAIVSAVNGFIYLAWAWIRMGVLTGFELEEMLSLFYHAVETIAETPDGMKTTIPDLINTGVANPERFANILSKTRFAGVEIIPALRKAEAFQSDAPKYAEKTLIDFAVENGWYLLEDEYQPIWETVQKCGETFFFRIKQLNIQPVQCKILAGFLKTLKEKGKLEELLNSAEYNVMQSAAGKISKEEYDKVRKRISKRTALALSNRAEQNVFLDILGLRYKGETPKNAGKIIADLILIIGKGNVGYSELTVLLDIIKGKVDEQILLTMATLLEGKGRSGILKELEPNIIYKLVTIINELLTGENGYSAGKVHSLEKLMSGVLATDKISSISTDKMSSTIEALYRCINDYDGDTGMILSVSTLLMRSSEGDSLEEVLQKSALFAHLLQLLAPEYRERLFTGEKQGWVTALVSEYPENIKLVINAVSKLRNIDIRSRFLEKLIIPLAMEDSMNSSIFEEILTPAVFSYNKEMNIEKRRDEESKLLKKLFRAEDRTIALDTGMKKLLELPGLEGEEVKSLLYMARYLCENLSQQSAWLEREGNVLFEEFLTNHLPPLVLALIEYPEITIILAKGTFKKLFKTIIPQKQTEDHQAALWQLNTAIYFFGEIMPRAIQHLGSSPELLSEYLEKIASRTVKAEKGKPAGIEFLSYADELLQHDMIKEMITRIQTKIPKETGQGKYTLPADIYTGWQMIKEDALVMQKSVLSSLKPLSSDKRQMKIMQHEASRITGGLSRSGYLAVFDDMYIDGADITNLMATVSPKKLLQVFEEQEEWVPVDKIDESQREYFENYTTPPGQNACKFWRNNNFNLVENIIIDLLLLDDEAGLLNKIGGVLDEYFEIIGYLGYEADYNPYNTIAILEKALSSNKRDSADETAKAIEKVLDKNLYKTVWQHRATAKIKEITEENPNAKKLTQALLARTALISSHKEKILFLKNFGRVFIEIEDIILGYKRKEIKSIRKDLHQLWLFDPVELPSMSLVDNVRHSIDICKQYFLEISTESGEVSERKATAISIGMRKQHSDNALTIATLLRWSVDSQKEELLSIIGKNPLLLETISRNTELLRLIDIAWVNEQANEIIKSFAGNPVEMQQCLEEFIDKSENLDL